MGFIGIGILFVYFSIMTFGWGERNSIHEKPSSPEHLLKISNHKSDADQTKESLETQNFTELQNFTENHVTKIYGDNVTFVCPLSNKTDVKWYKNGIKIHLLSGQAELRLKTLKGDDSGVYRCEANDCSYAYKLHLYKSKENIPSIIEGPTNITETSGRIAIFTCFVYNLSESKISWYHFNEYPSQIIATELHSKNLVNTTYNPQKLVLKNVKDSDQGWYSCVVDGPSGRVMNGAWLQITSDSNAATISNENEDDDDDDMEEDINPKKPNVNGLPYFLKPKTMHPLIARPAGIFVRLRCNAEGIPTLNITWLKEGYPIIRKLGDITYRRWAMEMNDVQSHDSGNYTCVVCNVHGCINYTYKVHIIERFPSKPYIKEGFPKNATILVNTSVYFECPSYSDNEVFIQWIKPDPYVPEGETAPKGIILQNGYDNPDTPEIIELHNVTHSDEGWYTCVAANSLGTTYGNAYLKVVDKLEDPLVQHINVSLYSEFATLIIVILSTSLMVAVMVIIYTYCKLRSFKRNPTNDYHCVTTDSNRLPAVDNLYIDINRYLPSR